MTYKPTKKDIELQNTFLIQKDDARRYFLKFLKPRYDRYYKLYKSYNGDRKKKIKAWQANISVPYIFAVVETLAPRIVDARPDFEVLPRKEADSEKAVKQQKLLDYDWEMAKMDNKTEDYTKQALIYGTGFMQVSWKKDTRKVKVLKTKDINSKNYEYKEEEKTFYDAPYAEVLDIYNVWYDWRVSDYKKKRFWMVRHVYTKEDIKRYYPMVDIRRLEHAISGGEANIDDYGQVRREVVKVNTEIIKGNVSTGDEQNIDLDGEEFYEVFDWWRPFDDEFAVMVNGFPVLKGGSIPNPYSFKEVPIVPVRNIVVPGEFEGVGISQILEDSQIMLNFIKNQRLDSMTLSIHKMWIVNPMANIKKSDLVVRPFGIIYSMDPGGVREVQFSDIKQSAYREEDLLKSDMRYSSGVDDFSMGAGASGQSATAVRHLRESTLERVRLFVNHLGEAYSEVMRYWIEMTKQLMSKEIYIRITGDDGAKYFDTIKSDDLNGFYDYKAKVLPSIAGQNDVAKKQDMDLFQLLANVPFVDQRKMIQRILKDWGWSLDSLTKDDEAGAETPQIPGQEAGQEVPPEQQMPPEQMPPQEQPQGTANVEGIDPQVMQQAMSMLGATGEQNPMAAAVGNNQMQQLNKPINLTQAGPPPTTKGVSATGGGNVQPVGKTTNPRGHNRTGKVNTNISLGGNNSAEDRIMTSVNNIQR